MLLKPGGLVGVVQHSAPDERGLEWADVAMLADDLPDASVFTRVGLPAAVSNAIPRIRNTALWVSTRPGGHGAAREFCDALLRARGDYERVVAGYVDARGGVGLGPAGRAWSAEVGS